MDIIFNELKKLGREINDKRKFEHLYTALPKEIRIETHVITYNTDWEKLKTHLRKAVPQILYLNELEMINKSSNIRTMNLNSTVKQTRRTRTTHNTNNVDNRKCYIAKECWNNDKKQKLKKQT